MSNVISKKNATHYSWGSKCDGWQLAKTPNLSVIQERVPQGSGEAKHYHSVAEQFFFILEGEAVMDINEQTFTLTAGEGIHIAPGSPHMLCNMQEQDLVFLVVSTPPSHGDKVTE